MPEKVCTSSIYLSYHKLKKLNPFSWRFYDEIDHKAKIFQTLFFKESPAFYGQS
jgi:hypothetical protein